MLRAKEIKKKKNVGGTLKSRTVKKIAKILLRNIWIKGKL